MTGLKRGNVILEDAAEPHDIERMSAQRFLVMIAKGNEEEESGEESDDNDSDGCAGKQFEMKMPGTEKPGGTAANNVSTDLGFLRYVSFRHYKFHKSK